MFKNYCSAKAVLSTWIDCRPLYFPAAFVRNHISPALGAVRLIALDTTAIQRLYNRLQKGGLSPKTIKNVHGVFHKALQVAVRVRYLRMNPSDVCVLPRIIEKEIKPLDVADIAKFSGFDDLVFTNELGGHLTQSGVWKMLQTVLEKAGIGHKRFHDLRHSYAVNSLRSGDDIKTLQENLGHHTASFTLDKYGHVTESMKRESAERMEAFIKDIPEL